MKKTKAEPSQQSTEPAEPSSPDCVADFCATDLALVQATRSMLEIAGRFQGKHLSGHSVAFVDEKSSELVLHDREVGAPGWVLETRIPCSLGAARGWSTSLVDLLQEIMRDPPPSGLSRVSLVQRDKKASMEDLSGTGSRAWAVQGPPETPPKWPARRGAETPVSSALLLRLIDSVLPSVAPDETRPHLSQILIELESGRAGAASTDGHRLTKTEVDAALPAEILGTYRLPLRAIRIVQYLLRSAPVVGMGPCKDGGWMIRAGAHAITILPAESEFPPYRQVIPNPDLGPRLLVETRQLSTVLKHFDKIRRVMREPDNRGVAATLTAKQIKLSSEMSKQDQFLPVVECAWADWQDPAEKGSRKKAAGGAPKTEMTISINLHYFLSAVRQINNDLVWLEFGSPLDPCVLRPHDDRGGLVAGSSTFVVVMPMRT